MKCEVCSTLIPPERIENGQTRKHPTRVCSVKCKHIANRTRQSLAYPIFFAKILEEAVALNVIPATHRKLEAALNVIEKRSPLSSGNGSIDSTKSEKKTLLRAFPKRTSRKR